MNLHPRLTPEELSRCQAARLPPPPKDALRHTCPTGDAIYDLDGVARWRFTTPMKQAAGERPLYLICYETDDDGRRRLASERVRHATIERLMEVDA